MFWLYLAYGIIGLSMMVFLMVNTSNNPTELPPTVEGSLCIVCGIFWPLTICFAFGVLIHDDLRDKRNERNRLKIKSAHFFNNFLLEVRIITKDTHYKAQGKINAWKLS